MRCCRSEASSQTSENLDRMEAEEQKDTKTIFFAGPLMVIDTEVVGEQRSKPE